MKLWLGVVGVVALVDCSGSGPVAIEDAITSDAGTTPAVDAGPVVDADAATDASRPIVDAGEKDSAPASVCTAYPAAAGTSTKCTPLGLTIECEGACGGPYGYECYDNDGPVGVVTVRASAVGTFPVQGRYCGTANVCTQNTYVYCTYTPADPPHSNGWICPSGYAYSGAVCRGGGPLDSTPSSDEAQCCSADTAKP